MGVITFALTVLSIATFISIRFKREIEKTIFVSACIYVLGGYILGLFNLFSILNILSYILIFGGGVYFFLEYKKNSNIVKKLVFRMVIIYVILIVFICYFVSMNSYVHLWDEFSHWATCVKNMYVFDALRSNGFTDLIAYPPFVSVLQYACMKLSYAYSEPVLYWSLLVFSSMAFCPIINHDKLKGKFVKSGLYILLVFVIPFVFFTDYFSTIYVDAILGIFLALIIYQVIRNSFTRFDFYVISIYTCSILLVKEFSIIMVGAVFIIIVIDMLIIRRSAYIAYFKKLKNKPVLIIEFIVLVCLPILMFLSWRYYITQFTISYENISKVSFKIPEYAKDLINMYVSTSTVNGIGVGSGILFWPTYYYIVFFSLIAFVCTYKVRKKLSKQLNLLTLAILVAGGVYILGILFSYMFLFGFEEAMQLASFGRYMLTILLSTFLMLFMVVLDLDMNNKFISKAPMLIVICLSVMSIGVVPFYNSIKAATFGESDKKDFYNTYFQDLENVIENVPSDANVFYICNDTNGFDYWSTKYYLTPIRIQNNYEDGVNIQFEENNIDTEHLKKTISEYDYVYLDKINQNFIENSSKLFSSTDEISSKTLYRVNVQNDNVIDLKKVAIKSQ